jgi:hypothetical protein
MTALVCVSVGLLGCALFLSGQFAVAFLLVVTVTQLWRLLSEFLRADFRGGGRLTAYQWMGLAALPYAFLLAILSPPESSPVPLLPLGLAVLWSPGVLLALQGLWVTIFLCTGRSSVTGATLDFHVCKERI